MPSAEERNSSPGTDAAEVHEAQDTGGVDGAEKVVKRQQRQELLALVGSPGVLELDNREVMAGAWR